VFRAVIDACAILPRAGRSLHFDAGIVQTVVEESSLRDAVEVLLLAESFGLFLEDLQLLEWRIVFWVRRWLQHFRSAGIV
jgi:hypothetical protein